MNTKDNNGVNRRTYVAALVWLLSLAITSGCVSRTSEADHLREQTAGEIKLEMDRKLALWYPRVVDMEYGGYLSSFSYDWQPDGSQEKMIVTQARHLWTLSKVAELYPDSSYAEFAAHGYEFISDKMWDDEYGGFYQTVTRRGEPVSNSEGEIGKTLYGNAFALYGLAAYYKLSGDPLNYFDKFAKQWEYIKTYVSDPEHGGWFDRGLDKNPARRTARKSHIWKGNYHTIRALMGCLERLEDNDTE